MIEMLGGQVRTVMRQTYLRVGKDWIGSGGSYTSMNGAGVQCGEMQFGFTNPHRVSLADVLSRGLKQTSAANSGRGQEPGRTQLPRLSEYGEVDYIDDGPCAYLGWYAVSASAWAGVKLAYIGVLVAECRAGNMVACGEIGPATAEWIEAARIAKDAWIAYNNCRTGGDGGGGGGGGGGSQTGGNTGCSNQWIIVEVDYNDGNGWQVVYEGWATVC
jgi:hypothetical protein